MQVEEKQLDLGESVILLSVGQTEVSGLQPVVKSPQEPVLEI